MEKYLAAQHRIFGKVYLNVIVDVESECSRCRHNVVCHRNMNELCSNYEFGTSAAPMKTCQSCVNHYVRWANTDPVKCFKCQHFDPIADVA